MLLKDNDITNLKDVFLHEKKVWSLLSEVLDPEIPVLSILDLGIVRNVHVQAQPSGVITAEIVITPTYSGCPAMDMIAMNIRMQLVSYGYNVVIKSVLSPAWSTDWISEEGKKKLKEYGIAAPHKLSDQYTGNIQCPQCASVNTKLLSQFGSTPCKALHQCNDCLEPFDYFKCH